MGWLDTLAALVAPHRGLILVFSYAIMGIGLAQSLVYLLQLPLAISELMRMKLREDDAQHWWLLTSDSAPPISIIIAAYNEATTINHTVTAALATNYPTFDVIVVNDGSRDATLQTLIDSFGLSPAQRFHESDIPTSTVRGLYAASHHPNLLVVDKENGGRADALNCAINLSRQPLFCTLDADSMLDPSALLKAVQPFVDEPERIVATGGTIRVLNGCHVDHGLVTETHLPRRLLPLFQVVEYSRAFLMGRLAWSRLGIVTIISGAFAVFRRDIAVSVQGFTTNTIGEDFELVMKIHRHCRDTGREYEIRFVPEPVCWTEVPEELDVLKSQRIRWQQGALEGFFKHRRMALNPRYGSIGFLAYPFMFLFDVIGPLADLAGYVLVPVFYLLGALDTAHVVAFICLFFVFGVFVSTMSLVLEAIATKRFKTIRQLAILGLVCIVENFGYRQYNSLLRIIGWWRFLRRKQHWGHMRRSAVRTGRPENRPAE